MCHFCCLLIQGNEQEAASSNVTVYVQDANDNSPTFGNSVYTYTIQEDLLPGSIIAKISADDKDSNMYGNITYTLRGFGIDKFSTDLQSGNLYLINSKYNHSEEYKY